MSSRFFLIGHTKFFILLHLWLSTFPGYQLIISDECRIQKTLLLVFYQSRMLVTVQKKLQEMTNLLITQSLIEAVWSLVFIDPHSLRVTPYICGQSCGRFGATFTIHKLSLLPWRWRIFLFVLVFWYSKAMQQL